MTQETSHPFQAPGYASSGDWTNWAENQRCTPSQVVRPRNQGEVAEAVRSAIREGLTIRAAGAGHSFSPLVPTSGLILDMRDISGVTGTDTVRRRVRALAGTPIHAFGEPLWNAGLALSNQGDIDTQTIAGALATATHGSGIELGSFSRALRWVRLVDGRGEVIEIGEDRLEELKAAQVALGTLGIFLEVELEVSDAYHLAEEITYPEWSETVRGWDEDVASNRHYSFLWCPHEESAALYDLPFPEGEPIANHSFTKRYAATVPEDKYISLEEGRRIDRPYRIYPSIIDMAFHEIEYFVPAQHGFDAANAIRDLMLTQHPEQKYPLEVRWVQQEDGYLSPMYKRDSTALSVSGKPGTNYMPYLRDFDAVLQDFQARPHWGKIHFLDRERTEKLFPEFDVFSKVRKELDPNGIFLNGHTRDLFG